MTVIRTAHRVAPDPLGPGRATRAADRRLLDAARNELTLERISERLGTSGPIPVTARVRRGGRRVELTLPDGVVLVMRYYWPRREPAVALEAIRWDDRVGWIVSVRTIEGPRVDYAWLIEAGTALS